MSSRPEHRRRDRSWERDDRDRDRDRRGGRGGGSRSYYEEGRRRSSRSRSPRRGGERDRRGDRREPYRRDREDERRDRGDRDRDRRDDRSGRKRDDDRDRDGRDDKKASPRREDGRDGARRQRDEDDIRSRTPQPFIATMPKVVSDSPTTAEAKISTRPNLDPDAPDEGGEAMDVETEEDAAMMGMMGLTAFGTTKGKYVEGNQEGAVNVKKQRTWRQYMNRRGGFNRPLDKIK